MKPKAGHPKPKIFDVIEHTADIGITGYGKDLKEVFENTAIGMFSLIADLNTVENKIQIEVEVEAEDLEGLMAAWLNELIYLAETKGLLFKDFQIMELSEERLKANALGQKIDPLRHTIKTEIKAATYHLLKLEESAGRGGPKSQVIFDV